MLTPPVTGSSHPSAPRASVPLAVETEKLPWKLDRSVVNSQTLAQLQSNLARIVHDQTNCLALWFATPSEQGAFDSFQSVPEATDNPLWPVVEETVRQLVNTAVKSGQQTSVAFQQNSQLIVVPIRVTDSDNTTRVVSVWIGSFSTENQTSVRQSWLMAMVGQTTSSWFAGKSHAVLESKTKQLSDVLATVNALCKTDQPSQTAMVLCNSLRKHLTVDQVAICVADATGKLSLAAVSDVEQIDAAAESNRLISQACTAAARAGDAVAYPAISKSEDQNAQQPSQEQLSLQQYCVSQQASGCISLPLQKADGELLATLLIATVPERLADPASVDHFRQVSQMLGQHLELTLRANRGTSQLIADQWSKVKSAAWTRYGAFALVAAVLALCLPLSYRIPCDCTIEPVMRRYVAAPYDGILAQSVVKMGDVVSADQVLARMDEGNLRIELAGIQAELAAARKRRDSTLAQGETAQSQIARSEMKRHQARIDLLQQQLQNLEIRSPIDGLVVKGDLEKAEGAPLEMGQTVFEVAPLEQMLAEISIDESEIAYATDGMPVTIRLNAFPFRTWEGTIANISPSTEIVNDKSVFVAEVKINNEQLQLKPGMQGAAKIRAARAPLGWSLFHRPWESVRYWLIW